MAVHILGIRHHGAGSAKQVQRRLHEIQPDLVMIEGPPEINDVLSYVGHDDLVPPVAIMAYEKDAPLASTFYPFAEYSPEWVAIKYANQHSIPVRALDVPLKFSFQIKKNKITDQENVEDFEMTQISRDPLSYLAEAAGFESSDSWWDDFFEQRRSGESEDYFAAVMEAMSSLREADIPSHLDEENIYREAYMRHLIREAQNEMYTNIAVICGAWHAPSLIDADQHAKTDKKIIKALPKSRIKVVTTWIPWTNERLSMASGYGAGIKSPGWFSHLYHHEQDLAISWLTRVAEIFRSNKIDISTAHIIEAYHLSQTLSALRGHSSVKLDTLEEAIISVMCMGDKVLLGMIDKALTVGDRIGRVPDEIPKVPLQVDFEKHIKKLRLKLSADEKQVDLDLRKDNHLQKSVLFHRLQLLNIKWAAALVTRSKGTFKESWILEWTPAMMIMLIDRSYLGNTIQLAARTILQQKCDDTNSISEVSGLLAQALPAQMDDLVSHILQRINDLTSISSDVIDLMKSLPQLIEVSRYGSVRQLDSSVLVEIIDQLFTKVCIGLPNACYGVDEENSNTLFDLISIVNESLRLLEDDDATKVWIDTLDVIVHKDGIHHIIRGCTTRLLLDAEHFSTEEATIRLSRELSITNDPHDVASWIEGFLRGSGMILIYDHRLWNLLYTWVQSLDKELFDELLPFLRRAFSKFEYSERRQIGAKAKSGVVAEQQLQDVESMDLDQETIDQLLPTLEYLMG